MTAVTILKMFAPLTRFLPTEALDFVATKTADMSYFLLKKRRGVVAENLVRIFGTRADRRFIRTVARNTFRNYARCVVDFLRIPYLSADEIIRMVEPAGIENAFEALQQKRGLILVTLHLGNWDFAGCYLGACKLPLAAVAEMTEPAMYQFYKERREHTGISTIPLTASPVAFVRALKENKVLVLAGDRDLTGAGVRMKFLTGSRMVPTGPERLAKSLRAPITVGYLVLNRNRPYRYLAVIEKAEMAEPNVPLTARLVRRLEQAISRYPDQWFIFQSEWLN